MAFGVSIYSLDAMRGAPVKNKRAVNRAREQRWPQRYLRGLGIMADVMPYMAKAVYFSL
jgi:hypothetical protein